MASALSGSAGVEVAERLVGEDHAPAERVVGPVALDDHDLVARIAPLHRDREVKPGWSAAEAGNAHSKSGTVPTTVSDRSIGTVCGC